MLCICIWVIIIMMKLLCWHFCFIRMNQANPGPHYAFHCIFGEGGVRFKIQVLGGLFYSTYFYCILFFKCVTYNLFNFLLHNGDFKVGNN
jgi:hypothetical protein